MRKERSSNFELLRIVAIVMIIAHHFAYYTILTTPCYIEMPDICKYYTCFLCPGGEIGVAVFFMITGFFLHKDTSIRSLKNIVIPVFFYSYLTLFTFMVFKSFGIYDFSTIPTVTLMRDVLKMLIIPCNSGVWWYVCAYLMLMLLAPTINRNLKMGGVIFVLYLIGKFDAPFYYIFKAAFFYYLGYLAFKSKFLMNINIRYLIMVFISTWLIYSLSIYINFTCDVIYVGNDLINRVIHEIIEFFRVGLIVPVCALSLFCVFRKIRFSSIRVNSLSKFVFGIYLLHGSTMITPLIFYYFKDSNFNDIVQLILYSSISVILIFVAGVITDFIRQNYFQKYLDNLYNLIVRSLNNVF